MLSARYRLEGDRVKDNGKDVSVWWKEFVRICNEVGLEVGGWFQENVRREVGITLFLWTSG